MNTRQKRWFDKLITTYPVYFKPEVHIKYKQELEEVFDILRSKGFIIEEILYSPSNDPYDFPHYKATIPRRPQFHPNSTPNTY